MAARGFPQPQTSGSVGRLGRPPSGTRTDTWTEDGGASGSHPHGEPRGANRGPEARCPRGREAVAPGVPSFLPHVLRQRPNRPQRGGDWPSPTVLLEPGWGWQALDDHSEAMAASPPAMPCDARQDVDTDGSSRLIYYLIKGSRHRRGRRLAALGPGGGRRVGGRTGGQSSLHSGPRGGTHCGIRACPSRAGGSPSHCHRARRPSRSRPGAGGPGPPRLGLSPADLRPAVPSPAPSHPAARPPPPTWPGAQTFHDANLGLSSLFPNTRAQVPAQQLPSGPEPKSPGPRGSPLPHPRALSGTGDTCRIHTRHAPGLRVLPSDRDARPGRTWLSGVKTLWRYLLHEVVLGQCQEVTPSPHRRLPVPEKKGGASGPSRSGLPRVLTNCAFCDPGLPKPPVMSRGDKPGAPSLASSRCWRHQCRGGPGPLLARGTG